MISLIKLNLTLNGRKVILNLDLCSMWECEKVNTLDRLGNTTFFHIFKSNLLMNVSPGDILQSTI